MKNGSHFDAAAFVFGVIFLTVAVVGLLDSSVLGTLNFAQLIPAVLIAAGGALLVSTLRSRRETSDVHSIDLPPPAPRL